MTWAPHYYRLARAESWLPATAAISAKADKMRSLPAWPGLAPRSIRLSPGRWSRQLAKVQRVEERRARLLDIDDQVRIAKLAPVDFFRPIAGDDLGDAVEPRLVDKKARIDCRRIR